MSGRIRIEWRVVRKGKPAHAFRLERGERDGPLCSAETVTKGQERIGKLAPPDSELYRTCRTCSRRMGDIEAEAKDGEAVLVVRFSDLWSST